MAYQSPSASNPSLTTSAYMVPDPSTADSNAAYSSDEDEIASLPSESTTSSELGTLSDDYSDAEEEWRESIEQLELLLSMVIVPFVGKFLGRKCAYWGMFFYLSFPIYSSSSSSFFIISYMSKHVCVCVCVYT